MFDISKKWDLTRIPENWLFTKSKEESMYKNAITKPKQKMPQGVPEDYLKTKIGGNWYYAVVFTARSDMLSDDRFAIAKDQWQGYGYKVHARNGVLYVRK